MKKITLTLALLLPTAGCASAKTTAATIVAASDIAADTLADSWAAGTQGRINECRKLALETADERAECMGLFHPDETGKVIAAVEVLVTVQLAIKEAAECEALKSCAKTADWSALAEQAKTAWTALKPYLTAARKEESK